MKRRCFYCFQFYDDDLGLCPYCGHSPDNVQKEAFALPLGTQVAGRYLIGSMVGLGGFGIIYRAWDQSLETVVAVKEYYPSGLVNRRPDSTQVVLVAAKRQREYLYGKDRFLDEARNLARFSTHPNIVNVFNFFEENETAYLVMEFLDGKALSSFMKDSGGPIPWERCLEIAEGVFSALRAIHAQHILHRDISPDNIFLCQNGAVKLIDFGAARFTADRESPMTIVVKPGFAPPEQYERINRQGPWTDLYALGATLYYAMTGQKPPESTDRQSEDELKPVSELKPDIPEVVSTVLMRAMALDARYRYTSVDEMEDALFQKKKVVSVEQVRKRKKYRRNAGIGVSITAMILVICTAAFLWLNRLPPSGNLTVWVAESGNPERDEARKAALEEIADTFTQQYDQIHITVELVPQEQCADALQSKEPPALWESTGFSSENLKDAVSLSDPLEKLRKAEPTVTAMLNGDKQYPTGLVFPVIYVNTSMGTLTDTSSFALLEEACTLSDGKMAVSPEGSEIFSALYGQEISADEDALALFLHGELLLYLGTTCDYTTIQKELAGSYEVQLPMCGICTYRYDTLWSLSPLSGGEQRAAEAFLVYLSSDVAQDYLHLRSQSGAIPLTTSGREEYLTIYSEWSGIPAFLEQPCAEVQPANKS